jgi:hypothetical protein
VLEDLPREVRVFDGDAGALHGQSTSSATE